jgi:hypothetical protein
MSELLYIYVVWGWKQGRVLSLIKGGSNGGLKIYLVGFLNLYKILNYRICF